MPVLKDDSQFSWWKVARDILKGKAKGSKMMVLGIFLVGVNVAIHISTKDLTYGVIFQILGIYAFIRGLLLYEKEAEHELDKRRKKK